MIANVRPSGEFLMEDFFYAGGLRALMAELEEQLDLACLTVTGKTLGEKSRAPRSTSRRDPSAGQSGLADGATAVLTGNLAPRGCVMKPSAADKRLLSIAAR